MPQKMCTENFVWLLKNIPLLLKARSRTSNYIFGFFTFDGFVFRR